MCSGGGAQRCLQRLFDFRVSRELNDAPVTLPKRRRRPAPRQNLLSHFWWSRGTQRRTQVLFGFSRTQDDSAALFTCRLRVAPPLQFLSHFWLPADKATCYRSCKPSTRRIHPQPLFNIGGSRDPPHVGAPPNFNYLFGGPADHSTRILIAPRPFYIKSIYRRPANPDSCAFRPPPISRLRFWTCHEPLDRSPVSFGHLILITQTTRTARSLTRRCCLHYLSTSRAQRHIRVNSHASFICIFGSPALSTRVGERVSGAPPCVDYYSIFHVLATAAWRFRMPSSSSYIFELFTSAFDALGRAINVPPSTFKPGIWRSREQLRSRYFKFHPTNIIYHAFAPSSCVHALWRRRIAESIVF
ncbi:hypothetical protein DFH09DRAFT_1287772 [Mycena vulgaris]|nr:hypothetical protein DFH09DRAFT_1287772 [Mycena vulgaris]